MVSNPNSTIQAALDDHLAGITLPDGIEDIVWHGRDPEKSNYLYAHFIPNSSLEIGVSSTSAASMGIYDVRVVMTRAGPSDIMPWDLEKRAGDVIDHFKGKTFRENGLIINIYKRPEVTNLTIDGEVISALVTIYYRTSIYEG